MKKEVILERGLELAGQLEHTSHRTAVKKEVILERGLEPIREIPHFGFKTDSEKGGNPRKGIGTR